MHPGYSSALSVAPPYVSPFSFAHASHSIAVRSKSPRASQPALPPATSINAGGRLGAGDGGGDGGGGGDGEGGGGDGGGGLGGGGDGFGGGGDGDGGGGDGDGGGGDGDGDGSDPASSQRRHPVQSQLQVSIA